MIHKIENVRNGGGENIKIETSFEPLLSQNENSDTDSLYYELFCIALVDYFEILFVDYHHILDHLIGHQFILIHSIIKNPLYLLILVIEIKMEKNNNNNNENALKLDIHSIINLNLIIFVNHDIGIITDYPEVFVFIKTIFI